MRFSDVVELALSIGGADCEGNIFWSVLPCYEPTFYNFGFRQAIMTGLVVCGDVVFADYAWLFSDA
jgi:hypothetical protein